MNKDDLKKLTKKELIELLCKQEDSCPNCGRCTHCGKGGWSSPDWWTIPATTWTTDSVTSTLTAGGTS